MYCGLYRSMIIQFGVDKASNCFKKLDLSECRIIWTLTIATVLYGAALTGIREVLAAD